MISRIQGLVENFSDTSLHVKVGGVCYEVFVPAAVRRGLESKLSKGAEVELITFHYLQTDPSKSIPILIGFTNSVEKDFFEKFITVSGVGPKAAIRALYRPIPEIAQAIDGGDLGFLKSMPGIGEQRAKEIIAKLQGKMGKFGLMKTSEGPARTADRSGVSPHVRREALEVLLQLEYKKEEARRMIDAAFARNSKLGSAEDILNEVYKQRKTVPS